MHIEIERKFLVTGNEWGYSRSSIRQNYLNREPEKERCASAGRWGSFLTIKGPSSGARRELNTQFLYSRPGGLKMCDGRLIERCAQGRRKRPCGKWTSFWAITWVWSSRKLNFNMKTRPLSVRRGWGGRSPMTRATPTRICVCILSRAGNKAGKYKKSCKAGAGQKDKR